MKKNSTFYSASYVKKLVLRRLSYVLYMIAFQCIIRRHYLINSTNIPRVKPSLIINSFHSLLLIAEVTHEDMAAIVTNLKIMKKGSL